MTDRTDVEGSDNEVCDGDGDGDGVSNESGDVVGVGEGSDGDVVEKEIVDSEDVASRGEEIAVDDIIPEDDSG